jgi:hypothetical protein
MKYYNYSRGINWLKFLAPASTQSFASFVILSKMTCDVARLFLKTLSFLSFQISQIISMASDVIPLRFWPEDIKVHHSVKVRPAQEFVWIEWISNLSLALSQRRKETRQWTRRWSTDSRHWLQSGQAPQFGQPRLAKRSAVQILFW